MILQVLTLAIFGCSPLTFFSILGAMIGSWLLGAWFMRYFSSGKNESLIAEKTKQLSVAQTNFAEATKAKAEYESNYNKLMTDYSQLELDLNAAKTATKEVVEVEGCQGGAFGNHQRSGSHQRGTS